MSKHSVASPTTGAEPTPPRPTFEDDLAANQAVEKRLAWKELFALALVVVGVVVRQLWLL